MSVIIYLGEKSLAPKTSKSLPDGYGVGGFWGDWITSLTRLPVCAL